MSENKTRLKRETQGAFCVLNANAKSQTRKSMKINVICTVHIHISSNWPKMLEVGLWGSKNVGSGTLGSTKCGKWDFQDAVSPPPPSPSIYCVI